MRNIALKKKTGCIRCKRRHKRCDELKPKCSYCARWELDCIWPDSTSSESQVQVTTPSQDFDEPEILHIDAIQSQHPSLARTDNNTSGERPFPHPYRSNSVESPTGSKWVQDFLIANQKSSNTYNAADLNSEIVRSWPDFAFIDKATCAAQIASWAESSVQRRGVSTGLTVGLGFEALTLSRLRRAISPRAPVSEEVLLAVTIYFIVSAVELLDISQLRNMVEGTNIMVMSFGGIDAVLYDMRASTMLALLHCDMVGSLLNAGRHFFLQLDKPIRPPTLMNTYRAQHSDIDISQHIAADVVDILDQFSLLLYLNQPPNQSQALCDDEIQHRLLLNRWIDYRLGVLQAFHVNDHSLSELFIIALIILKHEVIADSAQHSILVSTLLTRLQTSISYFHIRTFDSGPDSRLLQTITMWASLIALAGIPLTLQRLWFADYIHNSLTRRHGPIQDWPDSWDRDLRVELQQFLWHERIATRYAALCTEIRGHRQARGFT